MATKEFTFDQSQILAPALPSPLNRLAPTPLGASLTLVKGQALGRKTSDGKAYPLNLAATDGTQTFCGLNHYACLTDASGVVYFGGATAGTNYFTPPMQYGSMWTGGIFDPTDLQTAGTGTVAAEVSTLTPTSPTTGDIYTVGTATREVSFTVAGTQTAAAVVTGLTNAWNADPVLKALATPSGSSTLILTGVTKGQSLNLQAGVSGTGTTAIVVTTPATDAQQSELDTFTATNPTTGDVYALTITLGGGQTHVVSATVGATQTATAIDALLIAAWNADPVAAAVATASGTTTFILTGTQPGASINVTGAVTGTGTIAKVVTKPAFGRSINDILPGAPGARVLQPYGFWEIP